MHAAAQNPNAIHQTWKAFPPYSTPSHDVLRPCNPIPLLNYQPCSNPSGSPAAKEKGTNAWIQRDEKGPIS